MAGGLGSLGFAGAVERFIVQGRQGRPLIFLQARRSLEDPLIMARLHQSSVLLAFVNRGMLTEVTY